MKETLLVSRKGQITLPAAMRRALGLGENAIVTAEADRGRIVLTPAMVVQTEVFSDKDIARWQDADRFAKGERETLERRLSKAGATPPPKRPRARRAGGRGA